LEPPAITVENVSKMFKLKKSKNSPNLTSNGNLDRFTALDNVSFSIQKGEMFGIIGLNGSGKTTILRIIAGIYEPDSGKVSYNGKLAPLLHIGLGFSQELAAEDNIVISGMLAGLTKNEIKKRVNKIIEFAELEKFREMKLKHYSSGMRARLAFSTALQIDHDILLVDEILAVGDIAFTKKSYNEFLSFKNKGKTIVYTTHSLDVPPEICFMNP